MQKQADSWINNYLRRKRLFLDAIENFFIFNSTQDLNSVHHKRMMQIWRKWK